MLEATTISSPRRSRLSFRSAVAVFFVLAFATVTASAGQNRVGFRIVHVTGGPRAALWYPAEAVESPHAYGPTTHGLVALNAPPGTGQYPLVLFSHGFGGCGTQTIFFTEELARHGYIVAAPDHRDSGCRSDHKNMVHIPRPGKPFTMPGRWNDDTYRSRRDDMEALLDWMLASPEFGEHIDPSRIAAAGHSLGGYTALGLAGAWPTWKDPRIKAVLLFSPYLAPFLLNDRLRNVHLPVMYQGARWDTFITPSLRKHAYRESNAPKYFIELRHGNHFEWTNGLCMGKPSVDACLRDKADADLIVRYGMAFLDTYLRNGPEDLGRMGGEGLAIYWHER